VLTLRIERSPFAEIAMSTTSSFRIAAPLMALIIARAVAAAPAEPPTTTPAPADPPAGQLAMHLERVIIFKDGHGLFIKRARGIADADGRAFTDEVPDAAVLGCVWAISESGPVDSMRAEWIEKSDTRQQEATCITRTEILRANAGKTVSLELENATILTGRVMEVLEIETPPAATISTPRGELAGPGVALEGQFTLDGGFRGGELVALETETGRTILPVSRIIRISGAELATRDKRRQTVLSRHKRLSFDLGKGAANQPVSLTLMYFAPGIRWIPTYRLSGDLVSQGLLSLQGELLNEAEDIDGAALDLVVGVPNFRFREAASPLTLEGTLRDALAQAAPSLSSQFRNDNTLFTQRVGESRQNTAPMGDAGAMPDLAPELAAAGQHDLFVYSVNSVALKKGARAAVSLWSSKVPIMHVFTLDLDVSRDPQSGATVDSRREPLPPNDPSPLALSATRVWHQLQLTNASAVPWTTGAALLMKGNLPLGQDLLTYTPAGGATLLPVTVAVDVRARHEEEEIERETNALMFRGNKYMLVRKKGSIHVTSYRDEPTTMRVTVDAGGRAESASDGGTIRIDDFRESDWHGSYGPVNNHSTMQWELTLQPGESRTLTYTISFYVR
jgi:hypothetical protein